MEKWDNNMMVHSHIILESTISLSRNFKGMLFARKLSNEDAKALIDKVNHLKEQLEEEQHVLFESYDVNCLRVMERSYLAEQRMITPLLANKEQPTLALVNKEDGISIMVNEENHLTIQVSKSGSNLVEILNQVNQIDDFFSIKTPYAFDKQYGYLTSGVAGCGTGLHACCLLFLPALSLAGRMEKIAEELSHYGLMLKSYFANMEKDYTHLYVVSNLTTIGQSEGEILENIERIAAQIAVQEQKCRDHILDINLEEMEDKTYRSYGVLKYAKKISIEDSMLLLGQLKFGQDTGVISLKDKIDFYKSIMDILPYNIQKTAGKSMGRKEQDRFRANLLNQMLPDIDSNGSR